jgi:hypothetical protein
MTVRVLVLLLPRSLALSRMQCNCYLSWHSRVELKGGDVETSEGRIIIIEQGPM